MMFEKEKLYKDRKGTEYKFLDKSGGVLIFLDSEHKKVCRSLSGFYRWDEKETDWDILK